MKAFLFACVIAVAAASTTPTATTPTATTSTATTPTATTPTATTSTATNPTATTPTTYSTDEVVKKFKAIVRKSVSGLFANADDNHNNEFDKDDMKLLFVEYDANKDGKVSEMEFVSSFAAKEPSVTIIGKGLFLELDMDKNGFVTDSDLPLYFNKIDQNKDGKVSMLEFEDYFTELFTILYVLKMKAGGVMTG